MANSHKFTESFSTIQPRSQGSKALAPRSAPSAADFRWRVATRPYGTRGCIGSPHSRTPTSLGEMLLTVTPGMLLRLEFSLEKNIISNCGLLKWSCTCSNSNILDIWVGVTLVSHANYASYSRTVPFAQPCKQSGFGAAELWAQGWNFDGTSTGQVNILKYLIGPRNSILVSNWKDMGLDPLMKMRIPCTAPLDPLTWPRTSKNKITATAQEITRNLSHVWFVLVGCSLSIACSVHVHGTLLTTLAWQSAHLQVWWAQPKRLHDFSETGKNTNISEAYPRRRPTGSHMPYPLTAYIHIHMHIYIYR